jgi:hypothetical protein
MTIYRAKIRRHPVALNEAESIYMAFEALERPEFLMPRLIRSQFSTLFPAYLTSSSANGSFQAIDTLRVKSISHPMRKEFYVSTTQDR